MTHVPPGWTPTTIGALGRYLNGRAFKKDEWATTGRPIIRIQNLTGSSRSFNYFQGDVEERYVARPGELLVSWAATLGAYIWNGPEAVVNQHIFKVESNIDLRFHKHLLDHKLDELKRQTHGSGLVHITRGRFDSVRVVVPPLDEQRRIVDILEDHLSHLDAASTYLSAALRRAEALASAQVWRLTHRGQAGQRSRLDEVAEVRLGRQRSPANHQGDHMRPYLRAANVDWNRLRLDDIKEMNFTAAEERTFLLEPGDILVVEASGSAAEAGKSAIYEGVPANVCFQNTLLRVRCGPAADPYFIQKYLLAEALAGHFIEGSRGVGINHVGRAKLAGLEVRLPELGEQHALAERCDLALGAVEALTSSVRETRQRSVSLRRGMMDAAFSGRLTGRSSDTDRIEELAGV